MSEKKVKLLRKRVGMVGADPILLHRRIWKRLKRAYACTPARAKPDFNILAHLERAARGAESAALGRMSPEQRAALVAPIKPKKRLGPHVLAILAALGAAVFGKRKKVVQVLPLLFLAGLAYAACEPCQPQEYPHDPIAGCSPVFVRGDANNDGRVDLSDVVAIQNYLFSGGDVCRQPADVNNDDVVNLADMIYLQNYLFRGGPPPAAPFPTVGPACWNTLLCR